MFFKNMSASTPHGTLRRVKSRLGSIGLLPVVLALSAALSGCQSDSGALPSASTATRLAESAASTSTRLIPAGTTLVVVGQGVEPAVSKSMDDYVNRVGPAPAGFMFYMIMSGDLERTRSELATMRAFMDRYPGSVLQLGLGYGPELTGNTKESAALLLGRYDAELEAIGQWLAALPHMAFVRPGYEFDRGCGTYGPGEVYKAAYRHMVDAIRMHTKQVQFVWHSAGPGYQFDNYGLTALVGGVSKQFAGSLDPALAVNDSAPFTSFCPIADFFPGKEYVDYFSISYWGEGGLSGQGTDASRRAYQQGVEKMLTDAKALGLPLMISESTPAFIGTTSGQRSVDWMKQYFDLIEKFDIRMLSYIASEWFKEGGNWGSPLFNGFFPPDARIHVDPKVQAVWKQRLSNPRYVQGVNFDAAAQFGFAGATKTLPWTAKAEPQRDTLRWPNCSLPDVPGTGGWCLPPLP